MATLLVIAIAISVIWLAGQQIKLHAAIESLKAENSRFKVSIDSLNTSVATLSSVVNAADNALHERVCNLENQQ
jgi:cell division protein FtsL